MSEETQDEPEKKKGGKLPLILGVFLALAGGGGGYFAMTSGMFGGKAPADSTAGETQADSHDAAASQHTAPSTNDVSFVPMDPLVVTLAPGSGHDHLRFVIQLEVVSKHKSDVEHQIPRLTDAMNTYLRAVKPADFERHDTLTRIRSHLLTRFDVVLGSEMIRDVLIMEFVLS